VTAFLPTPEQRRMVRAMSAYGVPQIEICKVVGISDRTLRKAFREELDRAAVEANAKVAEVCFRMATSGTVPAATFFWLKTRAGWREVNRQEHTGSGGGPIQMQRVEDTRPSIDDLIRGALDRVAYSEHDASGYKTRALGSGAGV
jgi:hypothetical protein